MRAHPCACRGVCCAVSTHVSRVVVCTQGVLCVFVCTYMCLALAGGQAGPLPGADWRDTPAVPWNGLNRAQPETLTSPYGPALAVVLELRASDQPWPSWPCDQRAALSAGRACGGWPLAQSRPRLKVTGTEAEARGPLGSRALLDATRAWPEASS